MKCTWGKRVFRKTLSCSLVLACCLMFSSAEAQVKAYPNKTVEVILPVAPGGSSDISTRIITDELSRELKVPFVVTNLPGAAGLIGPAKVLKEKPDGYTWLSGGSSMMTFAIIQSPNPPYDPFKDFLPIGSPGSAPIIFGVQSGSPFKTLQELLDFAKKNPGKLSCGISSMGRELHLAFELLRKSAGVNIKIVPYKGTGEAVSALLGKHIDMMLLSYIGFLPYIKSGEARVLAITVKVPNSGIPTTAELGFPQVNIRTQLGFYCSAKVPRETYDRMVSLFQGVLKNPEVVKKLEASGVVVDYKNPEEFKKDLREEWDIVSKLAEDIGLKSK
jgi:tripartite-type tricarboxylate transporter receptor subunit TctC